MAAEEGLQLDRVIRAVGGAAEPQRQVEILSNAMSRVSVRQATDYWHEIAGKSLEDLGYAKALLSLIDIPLLYKVMGKKTLGQIHFTLKNTSKYDALLEIFDAVSHMDPATVKTVKAKAAALFQLFFLAKDRVREEGLPPVKLSATDLVRGILSEDDPGERKIYVDLSNYGKAYWNILIEQLEEADFSSNDKVNYEMLLNDSLIKQYENGSILIASGVGGVGEARLSDAVLARMGTNIIKRINLLLRTIQMYQSTDHPSVSTALTSLLSAVENALHGRETITFTRLGSDLLIEDVRVKKKAKFLEDFTQALEVRNVNSITLKKGISLEEARAFLLLFAETEAQIKKKGGVKKILDIKGVSHVLVDQFRYGIITGEEEDKDSLAQDEKYLENIVFTEVVSRIKKGDLGDMNATEVGKAFKELITGTFRKDASARKTLAQMILAIDPDLAEQAVFSKAGVRDEMSWTTARKMIDSLLDEIGQGTPEDRIHSLENLERMGELAITRNKETSLTQIISILTDRLRSKERNIDVLSKIFDVMSGLVRSLVLNGKYQQALRMLRNFINLRNYCESLPEEKKDDYSRAVYELATTAMLSVSSQETVQVLVRELINDTMSVVDSAMKILESLGTEQVIVELLEAFKNPSRSMRNRSFQVLTSIGDKSLVVCSWKLRNINDPSQFPRISESGQMTDDGYYVVRNCIDIVAKLGGANEVTLLRDISDDSDYHVRREVILAMAKLDKNEAAILADMCLFDDSKEVVESAIHILGQLGLGEKISELVDLFFAEPMLRMSIVNALARVGGDEAEKLLLDAARFKGGGHLGRIFQEDDELQFAALKALGAVGKEKARARLRSFLRRGSNIVLRLFFVPMQFDRKRALEVARDALSRIENRLQTK